MLPTVILLALFFTVTNLTHLFISHQKFINLNSSIKFFENETNLLIRTDTVYIDYNSCLEYRIKIEGYRTRVRVYACRMSEGGSCTVDSYSGESGTLDKESCHRIRAWMYHPDSYAFFFVFERRPRNSWFNESRKHRARRLRREVRIRAILTLGGIMECGKTCVNEVKV